MKRQLLLLLCLLPLLGGCLSQDRLEGDFAAQRSLQALEGSYRNQGSLPGGAVGDVRLSQLLWPNDTTLSHATVIQIQVQAPDEHRLKVMALDRLGQVLKTGDYTLDRDFFLTGHGLRLAKRSNLTGFKSGEPMVGVANEQVELGLDIRGEGKARRTEAATGLVYGFMPVSLGATRDLRFEKIK